MGYFSEIAAEMETLLLSGEYVMDDEPPFAVGDDDEADAELCDEAWDYYANLRH